MRLALILALALAACTGKNAAKGTVEYVPVVPLSVLQGAGGEQTEPDAAVGGGEAAGGALAPDAEVDAGAEDATFWAEPDAALPPDDAASLPADAAPAAGRECIPTVWTVDAGHDWSVVDEADPVARRCAGQCRRLANCSVGYTDGRDVDPCECIGDDDREQVLAECEWQCVSDPSMRILNTLETTETCGLMVAGLGGLDPFLEIACHGRPGGDDAGLPPDAAVDCAQDLCVQCDDRGRATVPNDDPQCPAVDCGSLDTFSLGEVDGVVVCHRQVHISSGHRCDGPGRCRTTPDAVTCGVVHEIEVVRAEGLCEAISGCIGTTPPTCGAAE